MTDSDHRPALPLSIAEGVPPELQPTAHEKLDCGNGGIVEVPKARVVFQAWAGASPGDGYGGKPILDRRGEPVFADLAILRILEAHGWGGVWVDSFRRKYRVRYWGQPNGVQLPPEREAIVAAIRTHLRSYYGCWDVYAWKGDLNLFVESKWEDHDRIRPTQIAWLNAAQLLGLADTRFLIVEWRLEGSPQSVGRRGPLCS